MKILLDECVPVQVRNAFHDHEVHTATTPPWSGLGNGDLLIRADLDGFDLLIVADRNMRYQQNLSIRRIAILELWTNHRPTPEREFAYIRAAAERIAPRQYLYLNDESVVPPT
jgi:hypothetical protein